MIPSVSGRKEAFAKAVRLDRGDVSVCRDEQDLPARPQSSTLERESTWMRSLFEPSAFDVATGRPGTNEVALVGCNVGLGHLPAVRCA